MSRSSTVSRSLCTMLLAGVVLLGCDPEIQRVSRSYDGSVLLEGASVSDITPDGRLVVFGSRADNIVPGDINENDYPFDSLATDVFVWDRADGSIERVSVASDGSEGDRSSGSGTISPDGRYVAFGSRARNLVDDDTNGLTDIFVRDRVLGTTERVSVSTDGAEADGVSGYPSISADGRFVAFESDATNLVSDDTNGRWDTFLHDRLTGQTRRIGQSPDGTEWEHGSSGARISADGSCVATRALIGDLGSQFAGDLVSAHLIVVDVATGELELGSEAPEGRLPPASIYEFDVTSDCRFVAFSAGGVQYGEREWGPTVAPVAYVRDRVAGVTRLIQLDPDADPYLPEQNVSFPSISDDGRFVAFHADHDDRTPHRGVWTFDAFVHDTWTGRTVNVSRPAPDAPEGQTFDALISGDGRTVAFTSYLQGLTPDDNNDVGDVFIADLTGVFAFGPVAAPAPYPFDDR